jgi:hypothetical protein
MYGMLLVQAHLANLVIEEVKNRDPVRMLEHLHSDVPKNVGHATRPTLIGRVRSAAA